MTPAPILTSSFQKHAVAIGVEPVFLLDRMPVGFHDWFFSPKRAHQHEECGLRQMKICQQRRHYAEFEAGMNKYVGLAAASLHSASGLTRHILQRAHRRGSDRNHSASCVRGSVY